MKEIIQPLEFNKNLWEKIFITNLNKLSSSDMEFMMTAIEKQQQDERGTATISMIDRMSTMLGRFAQLTNILHNCAQFHILQNERNASNLQ